MNGHPSLTNLISSRRWKNFTDSAAEGLQLNLTIFDINNTYHNDSYNCPNCNNLHGALTAKDISSAASVFHRSQLITEFTTEEGDFAVAMALSPEFCIVARSCSCMDDPCGPRIRDRVGIAFKLLHSFLTSLEDSVTGGYHSTEISVLRQMNQIILSLFNGDPEAARHALDLILSSLIVLLDARGSWLEYKEEDRNIQLLKGNEDTVNHYLKSGQKGTNAVQVEFHDGCVRGVIGVYEPQDPERALKLLQHLAQECIIVFEIENLYKLLQTHLDRVLNAIGSSVLLVDKRLIVTYANPAAEELLGSMPLALIGRQVSQIKAPWTEQLLSGQARETFGLMEPLDCGVQLRWVDWRIRPMWDKENCIGWMIMAEDKTDHYRWQETGLRLERLSTTATLVGSLAHELRNPISAAKAVLQLMNKRREPEKIAGYSSLILRELDRVTRLLNEFLLLGKPSEPDSESIDLRVFMEEIMPLLESETIGTNIKVTAELADVPPLMADSGQLTQIMLNLVRNAVQACPDDGLVQICLESSEEWVTIKVKDTGAGLSSEVMSKLFQPFFSTKERGTGLGLAVTQAIVQNHGGIIKALNSGSRGAVFEVLLPLTVKVDFSAEVVIAVSDDRIRYYCENALKSGGIRVTSTTDLEHLSEYCGTNTPSLILLEWNSPQSQRIEKLRHIWSATKLLLLGAPEDSLSAEGLFYCRLPLDYTRLLTQINLLLKGDPEPLVSN